MDFGGIVDFTGFHDAQVVAAIFVSEMFWKIVICFQNILQRFSDRLAKLLVGENKDAFAVFLTMFVEWFRPMNGRAARGHAGLFRFPPSP